MSSRRWRYLAVAPLKHKTKHRCLLRYFPSLTNCGSSSDDDIFCDFENCDAMEIGASKYHQPNYRRLIFLVGAGSGWDSRDLCAKVDQFEKSFACLNRPGQTFVPTAGSTFILSSALRPPSSIKNGVSAYSSHFSFVMTLSTAAYL